MSLDDHSAPGSSAGFSYQFERALYWLSRSTSGFIIGIETSDDVAILSPDNSLLLEQDKHSIQKDGQPFGNRSKDLWNTLNIWVDALSSGEVSRNSTRFLMVTNKLIPDCIVKEIGRASSDPDIESCIHNLENAAKDPPKGLALKMHNVLDLKNRDSLKIVIKYCDFEDESNSTTSFDLRQKIISQLQLPTWCIKNAESIVDELLGWVHKTVQGNWDHQEPSWIKRDAFVDQFHAALDRRHRQLVRERAENLIPVSSEAIGSEKGSPFVKQIHLVSDDESVVDTAICEYIRCNIEKMRLSTNGDITDDDWVSFEVTLQSRWQKISQRLKRMHADLSEEDLGFAIFSETTSEYREKLAGNDTEQVYLTSGSYHRLSNMLKLGWHPNFLDLMKSMGLEK